MSRGRRSETPSGREDDPANPRRQHIAAVGRKVREAPRPNPIERRMSKFLREPPSIRMAASVIVIATAVVVVGGGVLIRVLDHSEYSNIWVGMWWSIQTVTTVGYGDVTPRHASGRLVGVIVMLEGISFLAIITAVITSSFVARAESERSAAEDVEDAALETRLNARFDDLSVRFDRLESMLRQEET